MSAKIPIEESIRRLQTEHNFSNGSISLLKDKGLEQDEFQKLVDVLHIPDQTFAERRKSKTWIEKALERGDSEEISTGRYNRYVETFKDISSEQALVKGRMKFSIEYMIELADLVSPNPNYHHLVSKPFTLDEKIKLRSVHENFRTKDYIAVSNILEKKTNHDIVAANTWAIIMGQQLGLDENLLRRLNHFARTSDDVNANVTGELYTKAIGQYCSSLSKLLSVLGGKAIKYAGITCVAETHGQDAQLSTLDFIYANLAEQIRLQAEPLLREKKLLIDGKIGGAIGTDVDWNASIPDIDPTPMYKKLVEDLFGLRYVGLGNDQSSSNAALAQALDTMVNVGMVIEKAATDTWLYASREILGKLTAKGESGSSLMAQKANPFLAEGSEALVEIYSGMTTPIKKMLIAYREQGDLRRSITMREGFHPIMLSIISIERLTEEINKYEPNIIALEGEIYHSGPKILSSAIQTKLKAMGMPDAYDRIKDIVMKPYVRPEEITDYIGTLATSGTIDHDTARKIDGMLRSVMDVEGNMERFRGTSDPKEQEELIQKIKMANMNDERKELLGKAIPYAEEMISRIGETKSLLMRYVS